MNSKILIQIDRELQELIPNFMKNRASDLESLKAHLLKKEIKEIENIGHKVAGSAGGYGLDQLGHIAKDIEINAMKNNFEKVSTLIEDFENHLEAIEIEFIIPEPDKE